MNRKHWKLAAGLAAIAVIFGAAWALGAISASQLLAVASVGVVGMAVAANQIVVRDDGVRGWLPAAVANLYEGTLVFVNSSGFATDGTGSGANRFGGIAIRQCDNSAGSAGDLKVEIWREGVFLLTGSGFSQASVGRDAYATDNYAITAVPSASGVRVGTIVGFQSSTQVYVDIDTAAEQSSITSTVQTKTADFAIGAGESGRTFSNAGASGTITGSLPPAVPGLKYRFRVGVAQQLRIDPDGTETISLPSTGVPGAAGKYLVADAIGETVDIECVVAGSWSVFGFTGTWTAEP